MRARSHAGDEPPPLTQSVLDLKLLDPRASLDGAHAPGGMRQASTDYAGADAQADEEAAEAAGMGAAAAHLYAK